MGQPFNLSLVKRLAHKLAPSLVTQPPKTHAKKGSGNIVYNELSQTLECGMTNQIAPFAINAQSAQFIMNIIFT